MREELTQCDYIALTTDGWTDDFRKISFVTVTAHYFDAEFNLQSCILNTGAVDDRKTAEVLGNVVKEVECLGPLHENGNGREWECRKPFPHISTIE